MAAFVAVVEAANPFRLALRFATRLARALALALAVALAGSFCRLQDPFVVRVLATVARLASMSVS